MIAPPTGFQAPLSCLPNQDLVGRMDQRLTLLTQWVQSFSGFEQADPQPVSGDASFRRYFRVYGEPAGTDSPSPFIVMDAPPEHEDCVPFVSIAKHWRARGVNVPDIVEEDLEQGFLLLEDFGNTLLLSALNEENVDELYQQALDELITIQQVESGTDHLLPPYDAALLDREMALFPDWLLTKQLGLTLDNGDQALLETTFSILKESALTQPLVTVHRDYHSRNLLIVDGQDRPGVIDFQDAVRGPITYDLVSLVKDCYVSWPKNRVEAWQESFRKQSREAGLHNADAATFHQWFELMGMQRHLKAAGIFARLAIRDGKTDYLNDIPRTLCYLVKASGQQPALRHFHEWLTDTIVPAVEASIGKVETKSP